jgi:hypothetical protein
MAMSDKTEHGNNKQSEKYRRGYIDNVQYSS